MVKTRLENSSLQDNILIRTKQRYNISIIHLLYIEIIHS